MPRAALLLAIGLSATMAMAAEAGKGKEEGGKGVVSAVGTALKPTTEKGWACKECKGPADEYWKCGECSMRPEKPDKWACESCKELDGAGWMCKQCKPTKEDEKEDKDKGCWWEQQEDKEDKVKECARDDVLSGRYTPDMCAGFKKKGYCTSGKYAGWMQKSCFTTCNGCCADLSKHCPRWANEGYCKKGGSRQEWMAKNCRKSCGACCGDEDWECKIRHMGGKMKAMGLKFKEVMMQAEKDRYRLMEKMEDKVKEVQKTVKEKLGSLVNSLQECGCNVTRPEKPEKGWACPRCSSSADGYWKCEFCHMIQQDRPAEWICEACREQTEAVYLCKQCKPPKPDGFTKPGKPEITRPGKPEITKPGKPAITKPYNPEAKPTKKPIKPLEVKPNKPQA